MAKKEAPVYDPAKILEKQFLRYAHNHLDNLDKRFSLDRRLKRAQMRQPKPEKLEKPEIPNQIPSHKGYNSLIAMSKITKDDYAEHRLAFFKELSSAHNDLFTGKIFKKKSDLTIEQQIQE